MFFVLLFFGTGYALMELAYTESLVSPIMLLRALLNTAEGNSWDHLWYLYMLIALYLLTIPFRCMVEYMAEREFDFLIMVLVFGNFLLPSVNTVLGLSLKTYMVLNEYATYYLLGYWFTRKENRVGNAVLILVMTVTVLMIVLEVSSLYRTGETYALNHTSQDVITLVQSTGIFMLFSKFGAGQKGKGFNRIVSSVCRCSFAIYLVHPFFLNFIYKVLKITPLSFPIGFGIIVLYTAVFLLSWCAAWIMTRMPGFRRII